jgi:hypothetical protein
VDLHALKDDLAEGLVNSIEWCATEHNLAGQCRTQTFQRSVRAKKGTKKFLLQFAPLSASGAVRDVVASPWVWKLVN